MSKRRAKEAAARADGFVKGGGVNYEAVLDHRIDDKRHEREKAYKAKSMEEGTVFLSQNPSLI
jgi:hypothetical protein